MATSKPNIGYVVPHTHWDREWRYPIWKNRMLLTEFMDELLDTLEKDPEYACFVLDGQCVVIEDYLEVKPENRERIKKQVLARRLVIGPWYTLPDLYPLDGECLIRNMMKGMRLSNELGGHLKIGYNSFGWGQISQFPQIYKGFGIEFVIAAKRISEERAPESEFMWESPDGTRILASRLGNHARANMYFVAYMDLRHNTEYDKPEGYPFNYADAGLIIHNTNSAKSHEDHFKIGGADRYYPELIKDRMSKVWKNLDATTVKNKRLLLNGCDFTSCQPELTKILKDINKSFDDIEFRHTHIEEYVEELKKNVKTEELKVVVGEMRDGPACSCSGNALATRPHLKMANKQAQTWLMRRAEPLYSALAINGGEYPAQWFSVAWKHLLQAHPHDSINGVTQDKTADDNLYRLQQALEIAQVLHEQGMGDLIKQIDMSKFDVKDILLFVYNPTPRPMREVVKVTVDTPQSENVWTFGCVDNTGKPLTVQHVSRMAKTSPVNDLDSRPWPFYIDRHQVWLDTGDIPAGGYTILKIVPEKNFYRKAEWWPTPRESTGELLSQSPESMENEFLKVTLATNGTINLLDKKTGQSFSNMLYFEDAGDVGDYWAYYPPYQDKIISSLASSARVWCEENGPIATVFALEHTLKVPAFGYRPENGINGDSKRSEETRDMVITTYLTLRKGSRRLDCRTVVTNTVEDHRLRLMLPTGIAAKTTDAAGLFCVDQRPVEPLKAKNGMFWPEMQTYPMQQFVDVNNGTNGFALITNSLIEFEMLRDEKHTLAITLFRAMKNVICTEWRSSGSFPHQKGGQVQRTFEFEYALMPHAGNFEQAKVYHEADSFNCGPTIYQTTPQARGSLPLSRSLFSLEGDNLVLSCFKKTEDRDTFIVRLYNPTSQTVKGTLNFAQHVKLAWTTNLAEVRGNALPVDNGRVSFTADKGKIVTIEIAC